MVDWSEEWDGSGKWGIGRSRLQKRRGQEARGSKRGLPTNGKETKVKSACFVAEKTEGPISKVLGSTLTKGIFNLLQFDVLDKHFMMGTSEAVLQIFSSGSCILSSDPRASNLDLNFASKFHIKCVKKRASRLKQMFNCSSFLQNRIGIHRLKRTRDYGLFGNSTVDRLQLLTCKCQQAESVGGLTAEMEMEPGL
ncbi:hypothetical protein GH714_006201 [Hevea brasiliensis]|uniref:Uncharacterized protein n=1 Tax=Hevea brasiliensis TaxID=3981 RepID=A0A6A6N1N4_HEVBR|nr:hypothetical protein GH714_006201 [Hevea brasiliensis]